MRTVLRRALAGSRIDRTMPNFFVHPQAHSRLSRRLHAKQPRMSNPLSRARRSARLWSLMYSVLIGSWRPEASGFPRRPCGRPDTCSSAPATRDRCPAPRHDRGPASSRRLSGATSPRPSRRRGPCAPPARFLGIVQVGEVTSLARPSATSTRNAPAPRSIQNRNVSRPCAAADPAHPVTRRLGVPRSAAVAKVVAGPRLSERRDSAVR